MRNISLYSNVIENLMTHLNIFIRSHHVFVDGMADLDRRLTKVEEVVFGPKRIEGNVCANRLSPHTNGWERMRIVPTYLNYFAVMVTQ